MESKQATAFTTTRDNADVFTIQRDNVSDSSAAAFSKKARITKSIFQRIAFEAVTFEPSSTTTRPTSALDRLLSSPTMACGVTSGPEFRARALEDAFKIAEESESMLERD